MNKKGQNYGKKVQILRWKIKFFMDEKKTKKQQKVKIFIQRKNF